MAKKQSKPTEEHCTIIRDTREKSGYWTFSSSKFITDITTKKLDTGDYSIEGYESIFCIERKRNTAEIAGNVTEPRFKDCLERLAEFRYKFIICEFGINEILEWPYASGLHYNIIQKIKTTPEFILSCMAKIQVDFGIPIIYTDGKFGAEKVAETIIKRVLKLHQ